MERLLKTIKIGINEKLYLKDPESSELGKRILEHSIILIYEIGFENFTFRKLGTQIGSNESSIYRYFENKHKLLLYLSSWYWGWLEYKLVFATNAITDPTEKLKRTIEIFTGKTEVDSSFSHINEVLLNKIVVNEYSKSYLTKEVQQENKDGYFEIYKRLIQRISQMIKQVNADYNYPSSLASTILEGSFHQYFLQEHFPTLTDCNDNNTPMEYFNDLVFKSLK
ncbi:MULTISPECIES: TetR/AcrR family transcriptional regulator [unclassified Arenibacter]|jgi:AcrR family transcriptional regulator|uniref:TetR/AcrR family transcriptional regulator n=1 Tax=unclassified Arenibacter TaxID=2615047 RepID=UPI000E34FFBD|nr:MULTISPECIES: TetR/AcrR family transcriptional regulator [unclassified Arenibacter]MCM4162918.1 TetR family transcriptional regulator [Arenibacter sp. A80]RFT56962.1 TetR/AcrR family transcriptional regulator [Arenibacter sp. P308M17]